MKSKRLKRASDGKKLCLFPEFLDCVEQHKLFYNPRIQVTNRLFETRTTSIIGYNIIKSSLAYEFK